MLSVRVNFLLLPALLGVSVGSCLEKKSDQVCGQQLNQLRIEYAKNFSLLRSHMDLAKYYFDKGEKAVAFYLVEFAKWILSLTPKPGECFFNNFYDDFEKVFYGEEVVDASHEAEHRLVAALEADQENDKILFSLAKIFWAQREWSEAEYCLERAIKSNPNELIYWSFLRRTYRANTWGPKKPAVNVRLKSLAKNLPKSVFSYLLKVQEVVSSQPRDALYILEDALKEHPTNKSLIYLHGVLFQGVEGAAVALGEGCGDAMVLWIAANFFLSAGKPVVALSCYLDAYFIDPLFDDGPLTLSREIKYYLEGLEGDLIDGVFEWDVYFFGGIAGRQYLSHHENFIALSKPPFCSEKEAALMGYLRHPCPRIQKLGLGVIEDNYQESRLEQFVEALLSDDDPFLRASGCLLVSTAMGARRLELVGPLLEDPVEYVRFFSLCSLTLFDSVERDAGKMKKKLWSHTKRETSPIMKSIIREYLNKSGQ